MKRNSTCSPTLLAASRVCRVSLCDHDVVHLEMGTLTLRLSPAQLEAISDTLLAARTEMGSRPGASDERRLLC